MNQKTNYRLAVLLSISISPLSAETIVDFEELNLVPNANVGAVPDMLSFESNGLTFHGSWEFDCCSFGWSYSNQTDLATAGFSNSHSAYALPNGGGVLGSKNFGVMNLWTAEGTQIDLPSPSQVKGMFVTNTTYAYHAIASGNDGNEFPFVKGPFADGDFFQLDIHGFDAGGLQVGTVEFLLADFIQANTGVVSEWTWVDLTALGENVASLQFDFSSSDNDPVLGMSTPAYFAMDNLTIETVPEPKLTFAALLVMLMFIHRLKRAADSFVPSPLPA